MNFLKRAFYSVIRRKGKSLILFLVVFVLGNVIAGAVAIQQSTNNVERKIKADLGAVAVIDVDVEALLQKNAQAVPENLTGDWIREVGESPYVADYDYSRSTMMFTKKFKLYYPFEQTEYDVQANETYGYQFLLKGTNSVNPADFMNGVMKIVAGRLPNRNEILEGKEVAVISKKMAEENGLTVGDTAVLDNHTQDFTKSAGYGMVPAGEFSLEIVGLFEPLQVKNYLSDGQGDEATIEKDNFDVVQYNRIYMPNKTLEEIRKVVFEIQKEIAPHDFLDEEGNENDTDMATEAQPVYTLKSADGMDAFKSDVTPLLPEYYRIRATTDKYDEVAGSLNKLNQLSNYIVLIAVFATLVIISLTVILFARDRKHELGIYLSLGEKRSKVISQILIELLVVSLFAMTFSLFTGNLIGREVSAFLLKSEMLASPVEDTASMYDAPLKELGEMESLTTEDVQDAYEVNFSAGYVLTFLGVGLLTITGSAVLPLVYIMRLNPKEIML